MKYIIRTASYVVFVAMTLMVVLGALSVAPTVASADYNYNYDRGYYGTPAYNYSHDYTYYRQNPRPNYGPLQVSCYPIPLSARTGDSVTWYASAYGGNNSYNYTWSGTDGLSGYGSSVIKSYYSSGSKSASVTVISDGQTVTKNCDGAVSVYSNTNYNYDYNYNYYPYNYNYNYNYGYNYNNYYSPLYVTCSVNSTYSNTGSPVTWTAYPSGGTGSYTYSWTGTDNLYGSSQSVYYSYQYPGLKTASVTVYSTNGQSTTVNCGSTNVGGYGYYNNQTIVQNNSGLDVACYVDPTTARVNQPVTWRSEVTGGMAPYTYTWTGSDGLTSSENTIIKYYSSTGDKNAIVTIKSADGRSATRACSTTVNVRAAASSATTATRTVQQPQQSAPQVQKPAVDNTEKDNGLSAAALFSLKNVPWGWVAVLVILVLFATVVYLIFNRPKI